MHQMVRRRRLVDMADRCCDEKKWYEKKGGMSPVKCVNDLAVVLIG
jgi:hypothetical protein